LRRFLPGYRKKNTTMNALYEAAREVCDFMAKRQWKFCIIGGLAVMRWGEARVTQDVDFTLITGFGNEEDFIEPLLDHFSGRIADAASFALANRVLLLQTSSEIPFDISLGALPYEEKIIENATLFSFDDNTVVPTCSADDLFIMKLFAAREKDWRDAEGIVLRQGKKLNLSYISSYLGQLCSATDRPEILDVARRILEGKP